VDSSSINGGVGAATVLFDNGEEITAIRKCIGKAKYHAAFEAQSIGAILAVHIAGRGWRGKDITIVIDEKGAITTLMVEKADLGQCILPSFHEKIQAKKGFSERLVKMRWVPGHKGLMGNEREDTEAKK
ncbi:hypothetical protein BU17DRAFT_22646, partial [Hysterangium stoloniferum]